MTNVGWKEKVLHRPICGHNCTYKSSVVWNDTNDKRKAGRHDEQAMGIMCGFNNCPLH